MRILDSSLINSGVDLLDSIEYDSEEEAEAGEADRQTLLAVTSTSDFHIIAVTDEELAAMQADRPPLLEVTLREMEEIQGRPDDDGWKVDSIITLLTGQRLRGHVELDSRYPGAVALWETVWTSPGFTGVRKFPVPTYSDADTFKAHGKKTSGPTANPDVSAAKATVWHQEHATTIPFASILTVEWAVTEVD